MMRFILSCHCNCEIKLLKLKANYNQPVFNYELYNIVIAR